MKKIAYILFYFLFGVVSPIAAQDVDLFQQFNGKYDYIAIGNTLNLIENGSFITCDILNSSSANLNLNTDQTVIAAYLYWAGSGNGDLDITLNGFPISAERIFSDALDANRVFFAAFADVTDIVLNQGSTDYTISDFDLLSIIDPYCPSGTNFGGWAITVIYEDSNLSLNQLNVYDGLQSVPEVLSITLDNLNVLDNENAKIGFIAWEGDNTLAVNEQLTINGNVISNLPLNPADNAFNGTNSFTGATDMYNMDIDVYNIQNNINIGDTSANITLTSGQDFVMINTIITVLNSQLPDATITIDNETINCGDNSIELFYTVNNFNSTALLPSGTPIAFYANGILIDQSETMSDIQTDSSESNSIVLTSPNSLGANTNLVASVDDNGNMNSTVTEINEANNTDSKAIEPLIIPEITILPNLLKCNERFETATYDLFNALEGLNLDLNNITFYTTLSDLENEFSPINTPTFYNNANNPDTIYVRLENPLCYEIFQFQLTIENCPPFVPNGFSPNDDTFNDWFNIQGLYNIFTNHKLKIYNRFGHKIFEGNNAKPWSGRVNRGANNNGGLVPVGTYYYILYLNDPNYKPLIGWVYVNY